MRGIYYSRHVVVMFYLELSATTVRRYLVRLLIFRIGIYDPCYCWILYTVYVNIYCDIRCEECILLDLTSDLWISKRGRGV